MGDFLLCQHDLKQLSLLVTHYIIQCNLHYCLCFLSEDNNNSNYSEEEDSEESSIPQPTIMHKTVTAKLLGVGNQLISSPTTVAVNGWHHNKIENKDCSWNYIFKIQYVQEVRPLDARNWENCKKN